MEIFFTNHFKFITNAKYISRDDHTYHVLMSFTQGRPVDRSLGGAKRRGGEYQTLFDVMLLC